MTRELAKQALKDGKTLTHRYFSNDEFIKLNELGAISDEKGYSLPFFWEYRNSPLFDDGWSIYNPNPVIKAKSYWTAPGLIK